MKRFGDYLIESAAQTAALATLEKLRVAYGHHQSNGWMVPTKRIFGVEPMRLPPALKWDTVTKYRAAWGGKIHLVNVPVAHLIPCQESVECGGVTLYVNMPVDHWNDDPDDITCIVTRKGKFYIAGGHHRAAAAILMRRGTIPAELLS